MTSKLTGTGITPLSDRLQPYVDAMRGASGVTEEHARICVLYGLATHRDDLMLVAKFIPILATIGKTATGKSGIVGQMVYFCKDPKKASDTTSATMREEMAHCRTYLIDEADKASENLLLSRANKDKVSHMVKTGLSWTPTDQDVSGFTVLARRTPFSDSAVRNRSIVIHTKDNPGLYHITPTAGLGAIAVAIQPFLFPASGRVLDVWQPLLQIAMAIGDPRWVMPITDAIQTDAKILKSGQQYEPEQVVLQALDRLTWDPAKGQRLDKDVDLASVTGEANEAGDVKLKKKQVEEILVSKGFTVTYTHGVKMIRSDSKLLDSLL